MKRYHDVRTEAFVGLNLPYDLPGDFGWDDVVAAAVPVLAPHEAGTQKVLRLDVDVVLGSANLVYVPAHRHALVSIGLWLPKENVSCS
jgi:hypothetical protein